MCGAVNPVGNAYCDKCNARLTPLTASSQEQEEPRRPPLRGLSLPTIPLEEKEEQQAAGATSEIEEESWLSQLRSSAVEQAEEPSSAVEPLEAEEEGAADWLSQLRASALDEPQEAIPPTEPVEPVEIPDWLRDIAPAEPEEEVAPPTAKVEPAPAPAEVPDWLRDIAPAEPEEPEEEVAPPVAEVEPAPAPAEVPDWLRDIAPAEPAEPEEPEEEVAPPVAEVEPAPAPAEVPDWLRDIAPAEPAEPEEPEEEVAPPVAEVEPAPAPAEVPDWLRDIAPAEPEEPEEEVAPPVAEVEPAPAPAEIPDWLRDIAPAAPEEPEEEVAPPVAEVEPAPAPAEVPDWLRDIAPAAPEEPEEEVAPPVAEVEPAPAPAEIPDWLRDIAPAEPAPEEKVAPPVAEVEPAPAPAEVPDWLRDIAPAEPAAEEVKAEAKETISPFLDTTTPVAPESSGWLTELQPETEPSTDARVPVFKQPLPLEPEIEAAEKAGLVRAEIPAWLEAMRPSEAAEVALEGPVETEGLLEGLRALLPQAAAIEMPMTRESALPAEAREASLARAQLLQRLISQPTEAPQPRAGEPGVAVGEWLQRLAIGLVLLLSVLAILAWQPLMGSKAPVLARPGQLGREGETLYNVIEGVGAGESVLVAFEYGPAEADELDWVARPILRHLIDREADVSIASTRPDGLAVAERAWEETWQVVQDNPTPEEESLQYYEPGANYQPGDATGVSQLLAQTGERPRLIVVLASRSAPLRWWVEQTHARYDPAPLISAGVSAAVEAAASPYFDASAGQLRGTISGLSGAAAYESHRTMEGQAAKRFNALAAGHVAVVILMFAGGIVHTLIRPRREER